jgi:hypothetical protein
MRAIPYPFLCLMLTGCNTEAAEANPADDGNVVFSLVSDTLETSMPGEYSSGGGDRGKPLLVVAHGGRGPAFRAHQTGGGAGAVVLAEGVSDEPALQVAANGRTRTATFAGGPVAIALDGTLVFESIAKSRALDRIVVERPVSIVVVEHAPGTQRNEVLLPTPLEGQVLWVVNDDDDPVRIGETIVPSGDARPLLYIGGRFRTCTAQGSTP